MTEIGGTTETGAIGRGTIILGVTNRAGTTAGDASRPVGMRTAMVVIVRRILRRKKASECRWIILSSTLSHIDAYTRISPRHSPAPAQQPQGSLSTTATAPPPPAPEPEPELELEIVTSPPPVEETLAARRARRQAILAKYAGISSINTGETATPSPGPSSAAEPHTAVSTVSNPPSQFQSVAATPGASVTPSTSEPPEGQSNVARCQEQANCSVRRQTGLHVGLTCA